MFSNMREEWNLWRMKERAEINELYMTDESACDSNVVRQHKHIWRSDGKNVLLLSSWIKYTISL